MSFVYLAIGVVCGLVGALAGGVIVWLGIRWHELKAENMTLKIELAKLSQPKRAWLDQVNLEARTEVLAISQLMKLSTHDSLDALRRLNPQLAEEVIKDVMRS